MKLAWDGDDGYVERKAPAPFGYLLALDLYDCNADVLDDVGLVYTFLELLVSRLGMTKQAPPFVFLSPPGFPAKEGISGWVPLIESGIQIHTLTCERFVSIDVYCCHRADRAMVLDIAQQFFAPKHHDIHEMPRGVSYRAKR